MRATPSLQRVSAGYHAQNAYHTFTHGLHVMQSCYMLMAPSNSLSSRIGSLSHLEKFALLFSALAHDIDHPGMNNAFMVNSGSSLALRYNDTSVLENHHAASISAILSDKESDLLCNLTTEERRHARKLMIKSVLATDMAGHAGFGGS